MTPIVVTGAGGQLGSELCRQWGGQATGLDLPEFDLTRPATLAAQLERLRPQTVVNTAAYTQVDKAEQEPQLCRAINAEGVAHLAEVCRRLGCLLVQISTDYVFGGDHARSLPYHESDPPDPQGVYATTKLEGERMAAGWEKHLIVRTCGLYGLPGPRAAGNFVETMLRLAHERDRLRIVDDQRCTPSYTAHVARAIRFLVSSHATGIYHVVNHGEATWYDFAAEIFAQSGHRIALEPITTADYAAAAPRPHYSVLSTAKYHTLPGRPTMPRWQDALSQYLALRVAH